MAREEGSEHAGPAVPYMTQVRTIACSHKVSCVAMSDRVAWGGLDGILRTEAAADAGEIDGRYEYTSPVRSVAFSPDASRLAAGYEDGRTQIWRVGHGRTALVGPPLALPSPGQAVRAVAFSRHGRWLAAAGPGDSVAIWNLGRLGSHDRPRRVSCEQQPSSVAFSPEGRWLALAAGPRVQVRFWNEDLGIDGRPPLRRFEHDHDVRSITFHPDGRWIAMAGGDCVRIDATVGHWEGRSLFSSGAVRCVAVTGNGHLVLGDTAGEVKVFDSWDWRRTSRHPCPGPVTSLAVASDGRRLAVAHGRTISILDLETR